jgi:hypothetical protein
LPPNDVLCIYFFFFAVKNVGLPSFSTENLISSFSNLKTPKPLNSEIAWVRYVPSDVISTENLIPRFIIVPVNRIFLIFFSGSTLPPGEAKAAAKPPPPGSGHLLFMFP